MHADEMKKRTRAFALRIIRLVEALPKNKAADVIGKQLLRCGTSVGANYRLGAEQDRRPILFLRWVLLKKRPTKQSTGWNYLLNQV